MKQPLIHNSRFQIPSVNPRRGFTLVEVLIVIGLIALVAAGGYMISIGGFQRYAFSAERDLVLNLIQQARSNSMNNVGQSAHGFRVDGDTYVLFTDDGEEIVFEHSPSIAVDPSGAEVSFDQLSGEASGDLEITLSQGANSAKFTISENGRINWEYN